MELRKATKNNMSNKYGSRGVILQSSKSPEEQDMLFIFKQLYERGKISKEEYYSCTKLIRENSSVRAVV